MRNSCIADDPELTPRGVANEYAFCAEKCSHTARLHFIIIPCNGVYVLSAPELAVCAKLTDLS